MHECRQNMRKCIHTHVYIWLCVTPGELDLNATKHLHVCKAVYVCVCACLYVRTYVCKPNSMCTWTTLLQYACKKHACGRNKARVEGLNHVAFITAHQTLSRFSCCDCRRMGRQQQEESRMRRFQEVSWCHNSACQLHFDRLLHFEYLGASLQPMALPLLRYPTSFVFVRFFVVHVSYVKCLHVNAEHEMLLTKRLRIRKGAIGLLAQRVVVPRLPWRYLNPSCLRGVRWLTFYGLHNENVQMILFRSIFFAFLQPRDTARAFSKHLYKSPTQFFCLISVSCGFAVCY